MNEILAVIESVLEAFPELTQEVFREVWENNRSVKETAKYLGVSEKVVRTHHKKVMGVVQLQIRGLMEDDIKTPKTILEIVVLLGLLS